MILALAGFSERFTEDRIPCMSHRLNGDTNGDTKPDTKITLGGTRLLLDAGIPIGSGLDTLLGT